MVEMIYFKNTLIVNMEQDGIKIILNLGIAVNVKEQKNTGLEQKMLTVGLK